MEKSRVIIGLCFALLGYIFLVDDGWKYFLAIFIAALAILAFSIMLRDKFPPKAKKQLDEISNKLNIGWLSLAMGLFGAGIKFVQNPIQSEPFVWLGYLFLLLGAFCVGMSIGIGANDMLIANPKTCVYIGIFLSIGGTIICVFTWGFITSKPFSAVSYPELAFALSFTFIFYGIKRLRRLSAIQKGPIKTP